ncbi:MAG: hypothetical protein M1828_004874 [Chrysothrix sp. TS-e1954]|nr:MAG: hypothetical protein M1828_004874 [Chrysothrix sp. TS-e1954]
MPAPWVYRTLTSITTLTLLTGILLRNRTSLHPLLHLFSPTASPLNFSILLIALYLNAKSLPFIWHLRFLRIMYYQLYLQRQPLPVDALFRPIITTNLYTPLPECDYNGHKSNSTYYSDLDMARLALFSCILRKGIRARGAHEKGTADDDKAWTDYHELLAKEERKRNPDAPALPVPPPPPKKGTFMIGLGAVSCHFKREIKPYERYDIWTRVLAWDRKWLYMICTMVKAGTVVPEGWALQPWKGGSKHLARQKAKVAEKHSEESNAHANSLPGQVEQDLEYKNAIFASSIAKYVVKKGRYTIPPEIVLRNSSLLPLRPGLSPSAREADLGAAPDWWTWDNVEKERLRGLELAGKFGALDGAGGLHDEFPVSRPLRGLSGKLDVLGEFSDLWF